MLQGTVQPWLALGQVLVCCGGRGGAGVHARPLGLGAGGEGGAWHRPAGIFPGVLVRGGGGAAPPQREGEPSARADAGRWGGSIRGAGGSQPGGASGGWQQPALAGRCVWRLVRLGTGQTGCCWCRRRGRWARGVQQVRAERGCSSREQGHRGLLHPGGRGHCGQAPGQSWDKRLDFGGGGGGVFSPLFPSLVGDAGGCEQRGQLVGQGVAGRSGAWPGSTFPPVALSLCSRNVSYTVGLILRGGGGALLALFTRPPKPVGDRAWPAWAEAGWAEHPAWGAGGTLAQPVGHDRVPGAARTSSPARRSPAAPGRGLGVAWL